MNQNELIAQQVVSRIENWIVKFEKMDHLSISSKRNSQNRTVKEILGHLIDSASNNHQRIIRLQYNENLDFPDYRQDNDLWIKLQRYNDEKWDQIIQTWRYLNLHMAQVISSVDQTKTPQLMAGLRREQSNSKKYDCVLHRSY